MSTTQAILLRDFVREYALGRAGTATSATTTTLVDASNFGGPIPGGVFPNGSPIRITGDAGIGSNTYKTGAIDPTTGTITLSPAVAANTGVPTFIVATAVEHCDRLIEALNRGLTRRCTRQMKVPLTDIPDGDFLGTTASDHWTVSNATQAYTTLTMSNGIAQRCLTVSNTAANGFTQSDPIPVEPLESRNGFLMMRDANIPSITNTATLVIRDLTNSANITPQFLYGAATTTSSAFSVIQFTYTVPAGCSLVAWRIGGGSGSSELTQFANCVDNGVYQRTFTTQPHLKTEDDISTWYVAAPVGDQTPTASDISYMPVSDDGVSMSDMGWGLAVEWDNLPGFPIFYDEYTFFPALTSDTDTTDCDEELCLLAGAIELYDMLGYGSNEAPIVSRGKLIPTATLQKLQRAQERWRSPRVQRLLAPRRIQLKRNYRRPVTA